MAVPAIIVQGGGYLTYAERHIYKEVTIRAATEGYDILMVSGTGKYTANSSNCKG